MRSYSGRKVFDESWDTTNFQAIVGKLSLTDLNHVLYRCDAEERADGNGFGAYDIPGHGPFVYCGIRGRMFCSCFVFTKMFLSPTFHESGGL